METKYIIRVVIDTIILLTVGGSIFVVKKTWTPHDRGMFCNDQSIGYPFTPHETISDAVLLLFGVALPVLLMVGIEGWRARHQQIGKPIRMFNRRVHSWLWACYTAIGPFLFGCACSQLSTDIAKYSIGRLRPHFIDICKPDWSRINCNNTYVFPIPCTSDNDHRLKEARLSFPSGHASFSAYTMVYLAIYLQMRYKFRTPKLVRPFAQFLCLMMTFYTALSRISDYKHHWSDVLSGFILGTVVAILISYFVSDLFSSAEQSTQNSIGQGQAVFLQDRHIADRDSEANNTTATTTIRSHVTAAVVSE